MNLKCMGSKYTNNETIKIGISSGISKYQRLNIIMVVICYLEKDNDKVLMLYNFSYFEISEFLF